MASKQVEHLHLEGLARVLADAELECHRAREDSSVTEEDEEVLEEEQTLNLLEEQSQSPEQLSEEQKPSSSSSEEGPRVFPTPSLRRELAEQERGLMMENTIHVLPEVFRTDIDPEAIPKIAHTPAQVYIDQLAALIGCSQHQHSLAEYWVLDTLAGLLRRAQTDGLEKPTQALLVLWFCEWMKEMQHFDAADRNRMIKRFMDNMMSAATFVAVEERIPAPEDVGIHYTYQDDDILKNLLESKAPQGSLPPGPTTEDVKRPSNPKGNSRVKITFEPLGNQYECSLIDLTKIIHYIFDLYSTDYQYHLVRSIFTFPPDYTHIDAPYQIQVPKRLYTTPKTGQDRGKSPRNKSPKIEKKDKSPKIEKKEKSPKTEKKDKSPKREKKDKSPKIEKKDKDSKKGKKEKKGMKDEKKIMKEEEPLPQDYIDLMELKAKEQQEIEAQEAIERELWHRKRSILPLNNAVASDFLSKYWPPPVDGADSSSDKDGKSPPVDGVDVDASSDKGGKVKKGKGKAKKK
ncbi:unnamed protein product [Plutella xylostella]|uniref:(diamondback moth) hypothetical protein n=1 Tax=Plutella xylostella TaxID=51655 RepID=A0A8S4ES41_PLUXY|nr:unnamed protein product [Plutella xylostella]